MKVSKEELVSCNHCGVVYDKNRACDLVRCPVCDSGAHKRTPIPGVGRVHKWWTEVEA